MPFYEYSCGACHSSKEYFLALNQEPLRCEDCDESGKLTRVYHGQNFGALSKSPSDIKLRPIGVLLSSSGKKLAEIVEIKLPTATTDTRN